MATHPLTKEIHGEIVEWIDAGRRFALVTVLKDAGSVPQKAGTKAIVDEHGDIWGTIGGGLLEAEACRLAAVAIGTGRGAAHDFKFTGKSAAENDPVCGGSMRVLIDPTPCEHRAAYAQAAEAMQQRRRGVLVTALCGTRVSVQWRNGLAPTADAPADKNVRPAGDAESVETVTEPLLPAPLLIVAGGGHVGQALAQQASVVGFEVVVIEDRQEFADAARYPAGVVARCGQFADVLAELPVNQDTYIALVGRGHVVDGKALAACVHLPAGYIGMMGSRRKVALLRKHFVESGKAAAEQFDRIHAPIGLDIGAQTVSEIAASIVAELVAVRRQGRALAGRGWT